MGRPIVNAPECLLDAGAHRHLGPGAAGVSGGYRAAAVFVGAAAAQSAAVAM